MYTDPATGEEYCLFHAPAGHKGVGKGEFEARVFGLIAQAKAESKTCDLSGTLFPWDIWFSSFGQGKPLPVIDFEGVTFSGDAWFYGASFSKDVRFVGAFFSGEAKFLGATFSGVARFDGASFSGEAEFFGATFNEYAGFDRATFNGGAGFNGATFSKEARFNQTTFCGVARYDKARFSREAEFDSAIFKENVFFQEACFKNAKFPFCRFNSQVDFTNASFAGQADFTNAEFNHKADFIRTKFGPVDFGGCISEKPVLLDRVDLSNFTFSDLDVERFRFRDCFWRVMEGRPVILDELDAYQKDKEKTGQEPLARAMRWKRLEEIYRQLKRSAKDEHNESLAGDWHYREKEALFKRLSWKSSPFLKCFLFLYRWSSGYGENAARAITGLGLLLAAFIGGMILGGVEWKTAFVSAFQYAVLFPDALFKPKSPEDWFFIVIFRVLIPLQAALFAFALRNRLRR